MGGTQKKRDEEIRKVFTGESDKFLVIIGLVLPTTRTLSVIMFPDWLPFRKRWLTA